MTDERLTAEQFHAIAGRWEPCQCCGEYHPEQVAEQTTEQARDDIAALLAEVLAMCEVTPLAPAPVDYTGPDPSVECAYPPCQRRLRKAPGDAPQWCSPAHRAATRNNQSSINGGVES